MESYITEFTPGSAVVGGLLIGLAASVLLLVNGRVAGISGILGQACWPAPGEQRVWRIAFLAGLPLGAVIASLAGVEVVAQIESGPTRMVAAGLLVGFGTRLGQGCTSGHGVCGVSRGSKRSLAATLTFMAVGFLTVLIVRHGIGGR